MPDVPYELVARRLERVVQRDRELDDAKPRADVSTGSRADIHQTRADLVGQSGELLACDLAEVRRRVDPIKKTWHCL